MSHFWQRSSLFQLKDVLESQPHPLGSHGGQVGRCCSPQVLHVMLVLAFETSPVVSLETNQGIRVVGSHVTLYSHHQDLFLRSSFLRQASRLTSSALLPAAGGQSSPGGFRSDLNSGFLSHSYLAFSFLWIPRLCFKGLFERPTGSKG